MSQNKNKNCTFELQLELEMNNCGLLTTHLSHTHTHFPIAFYHYTFAQNLKKTIRMLSSGGPQHMA